MSISMKKTMCALLLVICLSCAVALGLGSNSVAYAESNTAVPTSEIVQSGLGMAINVVTAQDLNDYEFGKMVFDSEKLQNLSTSRVNLIESEQCIYSTTDIEKLIVNFSSNTGLGIGADAFLWALGANFKSGITFSYSNYNYKYFYVLSSEIVRYRLAIDNYKQVATYADCYSNYFLNDLSKLANGTMSYEDFFANYGTHIVGSATYGGRLNAYYSVVSNDLLINADTTAGVEEAVGGVISKNTVGTITRKIAANLGITFDQQRVDTAFYLKAYGGNAIATANIDNFSSTLSSWTSSFNNSDSSVVIGYDNQGLVPLWDLLPQDYQDLSGEMERAYIRYYKNNAENVLAGFETANYKQFAGGSGTAEDPFLLSKAEHLMNIEEVSMNSHYKMINDIDLSAYPNWRPIGGYYKEKPFNGVFDGGYHEIDYLTRTDEIALKDNKAYFGLFGCVGPQGVVKKLGFYGVRIDFSGPDQNNQSMRLFVGALAGSFQGTAEYVMIRSGNCSYRTDKGGMSFVGGVAGVGFDAKFYECYNYAKITSGRGSGVAGGIVAHSNGSTFTNCENSGWIKTYCTGWGGYAISGGIMGEKSSSGNATTTTNCDNYGTLSADKYEWGIGYKLKTGDIYAFTTNTKYE